MPVCIFTAEQKVASCHKARGGGYLDSPGCFQPCLPSFRAPADNQRQGRKPQAGAVVTCGFCTAFGSDKLGSRKGNQLIKPSRAGRRLSLARKATLPSSLHAGCEDVPLVCPHPCLSSRWDGAGGTPGFSPGLPGQRAAKAGAHQ